MKKKILWSIEKISWNKRMINIGRGLDSVFDGCIDYRLFFSPYHFPQPYLGIGYRSLNELIRNAKRNIKDIKTFMLRKSIVYIQRKNYNKRNKIVKEMMKYLTIDSYGNNLNNKMWPKGKSKIDILKNYKFCLAIENSIQTSHNNQFYSDDIDNDYTTEKLYHCLEGGSIPIYYGPKNSYTFLPNNYSAIIMGEFKSIDNIIKYIKKIEYSVDFLQKYISWTNSYTSSWYKRFSNTYHYSECKFCEWSYDNIN